MTELQRSILIIATALVILLATLILRSTNDQAEKVRVAEQDCFFDASSAYDYAKTLATRFPERAIGTPGNKAAAQWIESEFERLGLRTEKQLFEARVAGKKTDGRNIVGIREGIRDEFIVLIAHYDLPFHVRQGAMDNASGVGVLIELARALSHEKPTKTLLFVASDGEEWGMLGARHFVRSFERLDKIRSAISLDYVRLETPEKVYIKGEGQFRGYVPLWLWLLAEDCISKVGGQPVSPGPVMQYVSRAVNISSTDQGPFLRHNVPALNLGGNRSDSPLAQKVYHTSLDTSENLRPELFEIYGKSAELLALSLDELDYSTHDESYYLRTGRRTYVGRHGMLVIQAFLLLPLLFATTFQYYNLRGRKDFLREVAAELLNILLFVLPCVSALIAAYLLVSFNFLQRYELYPATPKDPFLTDPHWTSIAIVIAAFMLTWVGVLLARRRVASLRRPDFTGSKAVCLDVLFTAGLVALVLNGFAASLFLAPPALLWIWTEKAEKPARSLMNLVLIVVAVAPFALLVYMLSRNLMLGPYVFWYLFLGTAYRFFSPAAVLIAAVAATVGIRLLQKSLHFPAVSTEETQDG